MLVAGCDVGEVRPVEGGEGVVHAPCMAGTRERNVTGTAG